MWTAIGLGVQRRRTVRKRWRTTHDQQVQFLPASLEYNMKIYIAGPYTNPDPAINVAKAMEAWHRLTDLGFIPFCPHLCHFLHIHEARPYEVWFKWSQAWIECCDIMLRLPGSSKGADREEDHFRDLDRPVFHSIEGIPPIKDLLHIRYYSGLTYARFA